jgi:KAP family P-loop domain
MTEPAALARGAVAATLWDDNPALEDLLGFDIVIAPVLAALRQPDLDPITVGIHAPWGGGKSSVLNLLEAAKDANWIVVRTSPWEYEDQLDVKGTLIAEVLAEMQARYKNDADLAVKFQNLFERISWSRVGLAFAKGAITMQWDPKALVEAFTPMKKETPQSLAAFRKEFGELVADLPDIERVVVLVDDLDRCLPAAVMATLEAIKLFLSVKRMAFVIAADQEMVRDGIAASLAGTGRSEAFADRYLEKIVQLPVSLPRLSATESEAYIGVLLTRAEHGADATAELIAHCAERRRRNIAPLLGDLDGLTVRPSDEVLALTVQLNDGLLPSERGNPREIKRFLNAFGVRSQMASARGVEISPRILVKLLLLEQRFPAEFEKVAVLADADRAGFLREWEAWGRGDTDAAPDGVAADTRAWAGSEPRLAEEDLDSYITLASTLVAGSLGTSLTDELRTVVRKLLSESEAIRGATQDELKTRSDDDRRRVATALFDSARRGRGADISFVIEGLITVVKVSPDLAVDLGEQIRSKLWKQLDVAAAVDLASSEVGPFVELAEALAADTQVAGSVRQAATEALGG